MGNSYFGEIGLRKLLLLTPENHTRNHYNMMQISYYIFYIVFDQKQDRKIGSWEEGEMLNSPKLILKFLASDI